MPYNYQVGIGYITYPNALDFITKFSRSTHLYSTSISTSSGNLFFAFYYLYSIIQEILTTSLLIASCRETITIPTCIYS